MNNHACQESVPQQAAKALRDLSCLKLIYCLNISVCGILTPSQSDKLRLLTFLCTSSARYSHTLTLWQATFAYLALHELCTVFSHLDTMTSVRLLTLLCTRSALYSHNLTLWQATFAYPALHELCTVLPHLQNGVQQIDIGYSGLCGNFQIPEANKRARSPDSSTVINK